jgi:hypothetical protein
MDRNSTLDQWEPGLGLEPLRLREREYNALLESERGLWGLEMGFGPDAMAKRSGTARGWVSRLPHGEMYKAPLVLEEDLDP